MMHTKKLKEIKRELLLFFLFDDYTIFFIVEVLYAYLCLSRLQELKRVTIPRIKKNISTEVFLIDITYYFFLLRCVHK